MSSDRPKAAEQCSSLDQPQSSKASNKKPNGSGCRTECPTHSQTQSSGEGTVAQSDRPAVKKPNLKLKGRPKLPTGVGVTSAPGNQHPQPDSSERQEEQLVEIKAKMGILSLSEGKRIQFKREDIDILDSICSGTYCEVFKVKHKPSDVCMAAKILVLVEDVEERKRLLLLLDMMSLHSCPHIVQCYGYAIWKTWTQSELWVFMELMATSLDKLIKEIKEPFPEEIVCKMTVSIVRALHYLKEKHNVIHTDIQPSSILIDHAGNVKLCDFGIYGQLLECEVTPRDGGGAKYIAPERLLSNQGYDIRSDVWRLGTSLVELATGASPYAGKQFDTVFELLQHIFMSSPPLPDRSRFSPEFYDFVSQCLTRDVEHRPYYTELLQHPLIKKYEQESVDIALWFNGVCKKHGLGRTKHTST